MSEGNGRRNGEVWWRLAGLALAGLVAYFTAIGAIQVEVNEIKTTENAHFAELLRRVELMQQDIRDIRARQDR